MPDKLECEYCYVLSLHEVKVGCVVVSECMFMMVSERLTIWVTDVVLSFSSQKCLRCKLGPLPKLFRKRKTARE